MIPKHIVDEVKRLRGNIDCKKERIAKLQRLAKLNKNADLISEYDSIVAIADKTIFSLLESKDYMDAHKEQTILHATAQTRLMAKGLKASLCESQAQIELLNNLISEDNKKITELEKGVKHNIGGII